MIYRCVRRPEHGGEAKASTPQRCPPVLHYAPATDMQRLIAARDVGDGRSLGRRGVAASSGAEGASPSSWPGETLVRTRLLGWGWDARERNYFTATTASNPRSARLPPDLLLSPDLSAHNSHTPTPTPPHNHNGRQIPLVRRARRRYAPASYGVRETAAK
jgi:hypothetical protein